MMAVATGAAQWIVDAIRSPGTQTFAAREEPKPRRIEQRLLDAIADIAWGVEAGDAGLKSVSDPNLVSEGSAQASDHGWHQDRGGRTGRRDARSDLRAAPSQGDKNVTREIQDEWDEYMNELGGLLFKGYNFREAFDHMRASGWQSMGGSVHLHALERWVEKIGTRCNPDDMPPSWRASRVHTDRRRAARAFTDLHRTPAGAIHASVLHIAYGPPDPFVNAMGSEAQRALGKELAPLARYTETVETYRQKLVREEANRRCERKHEMARHRHNHGSLNAALADDGETGEARRLAVVNNVRIQGEERDEAVARVYDLDRRRTAQKWADRVISSGDAIRAALVPFTEPIPEQGPAESRVELERRREARSERKRLHNAAIDAFLLAVKIDANRMLTEASRAFEVAWERS